MRGVWGVSHNPIISTPGPSCNFMGRSRSRSGPVCIELLFITLTVGFETDLERNAERKEIKYRPLLKQFENKYRKTEFINLSTSSLGMFGQASESFFDMCKELGIEQSHLNYIAIKMTTIIIRTTYYIFCMRNKPWTDPELLSY